MGPTNKQQPHAQGPRQRPQHTHTHARTIAEDTGVVDNNVDPAERVDGRFDDAVAELHAVVVRDSGTAIGTNLVHDLVSGTLVAAITMRRAAQIVHHDLCAAAAEEQRVRAAQAIPSTRHHSHTTIEAQFRHSENVGVGT